MSQPLTVIKEWTPAVAALCAVVGATGYALSRQAQVAEGIQDMGSLATSLTQTASVVEGSVRTPKQLAELHEQRRDLKQRRQDSLKPALVVPQLSETARGAGLSVLGIAPVGNTRRSPTELEAGLPEYANYRVVVRGSYEQIADYMHGCQSQRIPVRVIGVNIEPLSERASSAGEGLRAEIVVEAFQPPVATPSVGGGA